MSSQALRSSLAAFRDQLEQRQQERRKERLARLKADAPSVEGLLARSLQAAEVETLLQKVYDEVQEDSRRYIPTPLPSGGDGQEGGLNLAQMAQETHRDEMPPSAQTQPPALHVRHLWESFQTLGAVLPRGERPPLPVLPPSAPGGEEGVDPMNFMARPSAAHHACQEVLFAVLSPLMEDGAPIMLAPALIIKLRQAVQAFSELRVKDAATLLRNVLRSDPHNPHILVILSQIYYFMAASGNATVLPEARDLAQRCMIGTEKTSAEQLAFYRYMTVVSEYGFSPERALEWIREHRLLETSMMEKDGLWACRGIPLRLWALMAATPTGLWREGDVPLIRRLCTHVIGGGAIYLYWFQKKLQQATGMGNPPLAGTEEIDRLVLSAFSAYLETSSALRQIPIQVSEFPWILRVRYLRTFATVAPVPSFEQILCNVALNGERWMENSAPNVELRALLNDASLSYWNTWALALTPFKDIRLPYLIPAEETLADSAMLATCDALLKTLREEEVQRIKPHLWNELKPWMPRWEIDHLLAVATGSNKPRTRFSPSLTPYTHFYRNWQDPVAQGFSGSEVVQETARRGGFASLFEVLAAIDGAARLMDDPVHGLVNTQKRALAAANQYNPRKYKTVQSEFGASKGVGAMTIVLPLATLGALAGIVTFSSNWGQAFGLILATMGVVGVVLLNLNMSSEGN